MVTFSINDRVRYYNGRTVKKGTVIEIDEAFQKVRVRWDEQKARTWIKISALDKLKEERFDNEKGENAPY